MESHEICPTKSTKQLELLEFPMELPNFVAGAPPAVWIVVLPVAQPASPPARRIGAIVSLCFLKRY